MNQSAKDTTDLAGRALLSFFNGGMAVYIFFVLSGCVLVASLQREGAFGLSSAGRFIGRRVFRIFPASIFAILLFGVLSHIALPATRTYSFSIKEIFDNCVLYSVDVIGATWTLQVEMLMAPVIIAVAWLGSRIGVLAFAAFLFWAQTCVFVGSPVYPDLLNVALPAFALGMLIPSEMVKAAVRNLPHVGALPCLGAMVLVRFCYPINDISALLAILGLAFSGVAILYHSNTRSHVLDHPFFIFLGRISFSLYLLHVVIIYELFPFYAGVLGIERVSTHYMIFGLIFVVIVAAITIPLAALVERYVEQPFVRMGHSLFGAKRMEFKPTHSTIAQ